MTVPTTRAFLDCGLPTAVYLRDVEFHQLDGDLATIKDAIFIANSQFTANRYAEAFGISASIVPPMFQREQYATARTGRQQYVTYINPHPLKGLDLALELTSQFPTTEFLFVESWGIASPEDRKQLRDRIVSRLNVTLVPPTQNMRSIYAKTDILLMPSRWEEAWGRVVSEAQFSGIPVIASKVGGLPESVGPGGILIDPSEPLDTWCRALDQLIKDDSFYANLSQAALRYSARPEIDGVHQVQQVLDLVAGDTLQRACRKLVPLTRP
jgi:glycosyltransferase involved in cell wall biosynthesis